ncbi:Hsp70 family protein [Actinomycetospora termitidis]|uniref:Hsp70 family protein n=1 Tax=Actinomycetospora termitidis TaxID=3053470 RepID=A0ABT7ME48_9PSEU|nr:Hsp70 family protein [Actinomycetospora sp. Odt1-22]MDL5158941.1 Hsp70 family protein [Actinomycetospora sp. Odt1-22]
MNRPWSLAIDYGTSFTTAATRVEGGPIEVLEIGSSRYLPSMVCLGPDGEFLVGRDAVSEAVLDPTRAERLPKRALAAAPAVHLGDVNVETIDLVGAVLARVSFEARRRHGGRPPDRVVLTHPARWQSGGVELIRLSEAASRAGLGRPELIAEPVAAAHHYVNVSGADLPVGGAIGVYDLGGGTFDTAVLRRSRTGFELAGPPGGDLNLGGEDLDAELLTLVSDYAETHDPQRWSDLWGRDDLVALKARTRFRQDITETKESLSSRLTAAFPLPWSSEAMRLTRSEYEQAVTEILTRSVDEMIDTVMRAGLTPQGLADLYLTGGSSRTPLVTTLLAAKLHRVPTTLDDPKAVVVQGALQVEPGRGSDDRPDAALVAAAHELTVLAAAAGVGDLIGVVSVEGRGEPVVYLRGVIEEIGLGIAKRFGPFTSLPPEVSLQLLREGRSELGELGRSLSRLDLVANRLPEVAAPASAPRGVRWG